MSESLFEIHRFSVACIGLIPEYPITENGHGRKKEGATGKESVKQGNVEDEDVVFKLSFAQTLDVPQVESKLIKIMCEVNKQIADSVSSPYSKLIRHILS